jgi:hypothetical protein
MNDFLVWLGIMCGAYALILLFRGLFYAMQYLNILWRREK